jgi:hypothetical protein
MSDAPIYTLADTLARTHVDDRAAIDAVRVVMSLLSDDVLGAIASRTSLDTDAVRGHLVAMATLLTERHLP